MKQPLETIVALVPGGVTKPFYDAAQIIIENYRTRRGKDPLENSLNAAMSYTRAAFYLTAGVGWDLMTILAAYAGTTAVQNLAAQDPEQATRAGLMGAGIYSGCRLAQYGFGCILRWHERRDSPRAGSLAQDPVNTII